MGELEIIEQILLIEQIQQERKASNKLLSYNTGEKKHLKQMKWGKQNENRR